MTKKILMQNKSRKNRIFYDFFIRYLYCLLFNGETKLDIDMLVPTYVSQMRAKRFIDTEYYRENYHQLNRDTGELLVPMRTLLTTKLINELTTFLEQAPPHLKFCRDKCKFDEYFFQRTDLTDCHLSAVNEDMMMFDKRRVLRTYVREDGTAYHYFDINWDDEAFADPNWIDKVTPKCTKDLL